MFGEWNEIMAVKKSKFISHFTAWGETTSDRGVGIRT